MAKKGKVKGKPVESSSKPKISKLASIVEKVQSTFGSDAMFLMDDEDSYLKLDVEFIPSGICAYDWITGGGFPRGRITEIYGPESCLSSETYIPYEVWDKNETVRRNHKGGSIRRLYERFSLEEDGGKKQGRHLQNNDSNFYVKSVNDEGFIVKNRVIDVVKTGKKRCFKVLTEKGFSIVSTAEHKYMTSIGFVPLEGLTIGSSIYIHNSTRFKGRQAHESRRPSVCVKYHPLLPAKVVDGKYLYYRGQISRLAYEAHMNELPYDKYIDILNNESKSIIDALWFLPSNIHVHHEDENFLNNDISNLILVDPSEHGRLHATSRLKNLSFIAIEDKIVSIEDDGDHETYDIRCEYPYNNYVANGFVVHNSGKSSLGYSGLRSAQFLGLAGAIIDMEHTIDPLWAKVIGIDLSNLAISKPDNGEDALQILELLVEEEIDFALIDSVAALVPIEETELSKSQKEKGAKSTIGNTQPGRQAALMSSGLRQLNPKISKSRTAVTFINQLRYKIGIMFGNPETQSGGNALKFYASGRNDVRRKIVDDNKQGGVVLSNEMIIKNVKNKVGFPLRKAEGGCRIDYTHGFNVVSSFVWTLAQTCPHLKSGSWWNVDGIKVQGDKQLAAEMNKNPKLLEACTGRIKAAFPKFNADFYNKFIPYHINELERRKKEIEAERARIEEEAKK